MYVRILLVEVLIRNKNIIEQWKHKFAENSVRKAEMDKITWKCAQWRLISDKQ